MTFEVNPDYTWGPKPKVATIVYRIIGDPTAAVQAMENEEIDIIQPQATADILTQLEALADRGVEVAPGDGGTYEHVDLVVNNGGPFDPATYGGDEAQGARGAPGVPQDDPPPGHHRPPDHAAERGRHRAQLVQAAVPGAPIYDAAGRRERLRRVRRGRHRAAPGAARGGRRRHARRSTCASCSPPTTRGGPASTS